MILSSKLTWKIEDMNVLSATTTTSLLCWCAISDTALMSINRISGLVGDSNQTSFVFAFMAARSLSKLDKSTKDTSIPIVDPKYRKKRFVPEMNEVFFVRSIEIISKITVLACSCKKAYTWEAKAWKLKTEIAFNLNLQENSIIS